MQKKLHIKKGDTVMIITGESKGQKGRVLEVDRDKNKGVRGKEIVVSKSGSKVIVIVVPTNEEFVIASETKTIVENLKK